MTPRATYRLQLHEGFTFADVEHHAAYFARLGISHLYFSPIMTARPGSRHGYDVVDPTCVNPELGGEGGLRRLVAHLRRLDLGVIVDVVPNHMFVGGNDNRWWNDVLRHGRSSAFAKFFDIDWRSGNAGLNDKILLPILGEPYGTMLENGGLRVERQPDGDLALRYGERILPLDPATTETMGSPHSLLEQQHYRLAWWRAAADEINWRRFFDITDLAALRVEDAEVFEAVHATVLRLYSEGLIDGLRIDHIDGLTDPAAYCRRLRERLNLLMQKRPPEAPAGPAPIVVEKILATGEALPRDWAVDGTTGYDFMNYVSAALHDECGEAALTALWRETSGRTGDFEGEERLARREVLDRSFGAQFDALARSAEGLAERDLVARDVGPGVLRRALEHILVRFRRYRSYADATISDRAYLASAIEAAQASALPADRIAFDLIGRWLVTAPSDPELERFQVRFRQLTAPLAAKAVEDTALYRYGRLLSRNDVGFDASCFALPSETWHRAMARRREDWPRSWLATATHDHKRGEDVRARLAVLSELPDEWAATLRASMELNRASKDMIEGRPAPSPGDEAILYQTIVGTWPLAREDAEGAGRETYLSRLCQWQGKALREAKLETEWIMPNKAYEAVARRFLERIFSDDGEGLRLLTDFARRIAPAGAVTGLSQTLLKLASPGVPDFYQGTEFWDQSLVDPDNRQAVDFAARSDALAVRESPAECLRHWQTGTVKQAVIARALQFRKDHPRLFAEGSYVALSAVGPMAANVLASARVLGDTAVVLVALRSIAHLLTADGGLLVPAAAWQGTVLNIPAPLQGRVMRDLLTDDLHRIGPTLAAGTILSRFPGAFLASV